MEHAKVKIEGTVVTSMVDPGSSTTIISYEKFCEIGKQAGIPAGNLERPDLVYVIIISKSSQLEQG